MTHAFFKALLFLAAGSVIHAMGGEQDMRRMAPQQENQSHLLDDAHRHARHRRLPAARGFFSKDSILGAAFQIPGGHPLYAVGLLTRCSLRSTCSA